MKTAGSYDFAIVAAFTVDDFRPVERIRRLKLIGAFPCSVLVYTHIPINTVGRRSTHALARPVPECNRGAFGNPLEIAAMMANTRQWNVQSSIELQFVGCYLERRYALVIARTLMRASDRLAENVVGNIPNRVG